MGKILYSSILQYSNFFWTEKKKKKSHGEDRAGPRTSTDIDTVLVFGAG